MMSTQISKTFKQQKAVPQRSSRKRKAELPAESAGAIAGEKNVDISEEEGLLRQFDLATKYGPCIGLTRLQRWERAEKFGLNPPASVKEILERNVETDKNLCIWTNRV